MPKQKTNKTASKRFKITKTGKLLRRRQGISHLRRKESSSVKQRKNSLAELKGARKKKVIKLI